MKPEGPLVRRRTWPCAIVSCAVASIVVAGLLLAVGRVNEEWHIDPGLQQKDSLTYLRLATNILKRQTYSRSAVDPFWPEVDVPPGYPAFLAAIIHFLGYPSVFVVQALLFVVASVLIATAVTKCYGPVAGGTAGLLLALDLSLVATSQAVLSEALFVPLAAAFIWCTGDVRPRWRYAAAITLATCMVLVRAVALYWALALPVLVACASVRTTTGRPLARTVIALLMTWGAVGAWTLRNAAVADCVTFSLGGSINLVYYVGAGAWQEQYGIDHREARQRIAEEFRLPPYSQCKNRPHEWPGGIAAVHTALKQAAPQVLGHHKVALLRSEAKGILKGMFSHSVEFIGRLVKRDWKAPGLQNLAMLRPAAFQTLAANGWLLACAFAWEIVHMAILWLLAGIGVLAAVKRGMHSAPAGLFWGFSLVYFTVMIGGFGQQTYWRSRLPATPFAAAMGGIGFATVWSRISRSSS